MSLSKRRRRAARAGDDGAAPGSRLRRAVTYLRYRPGRGRVSDVEVIARRLAEERDQRRQEPWRAW